MQYSIFPKKTHYIKLKTPKDVLFKELSGIIEYGASSSIWFKKNDKIFAGYIQGEKFDIKLKTSYRNSFKPRIYIEIIEHNSFTELKIEYQIETITKIFMVLFIILLLFIQSIQIYFNIDRIIKGVHLESLFPLGMLFFLFLLSRMGFYMSMGQSDTVLYKFLIKVERKYLGMHAGSFGKK